MNIDEKLIKEIESYCKLNSIDDVDWQINYCLRQGFNILKYGLNPQDNYNIENNIVKKEVKKDETVTQKRKPGRPKKQKESESGNTATAEKKEVEPVKEDEKQVNGEESVIKVKKSKIRIIKK